jgi:HSP20 family protein|tara:strand:+ start:47351 stop:47785 length:435 start_codon:yes stop_codon:yes gene_type:complete
MKIFGKELGKAIKFPPFLDNFVDKLLPHRKKDDEELVTIPSTNISDDNVAFELSVALPGLEKKDVHIEVVDNYLTISAQLEHKTEEEDRNWVRQEFVHNSFYRAFSLPNNVDPEQLEAKMKNGLLTLKIGKKKGRPTQRIIKVN